MTQDARDDRLLGHGGNNTERAALAKDRWPYPEQTHARYSSQPISSIFSFTACATMSCPSADQWVSVRA
jgi:hypothetical protein